MRSIQCIKSFDDVGSKISYKQGQSYIMSEDTEALYRANLGDVLGVSRLVQSKYNGEDLSGKSILAFRQGGIGDVMFLTPALHYIKQKYENCSITVATACPDALINNPDVSEILPMPFNGDLLTKYDYYIFFQGIIEGCSKESKTIPAVDLFIKAFKVNPDDIKPEDKLPRLTFSTKEYEWLEKWESINNISRDDILIGIQIESSSARRNFPPFKLKQIVDVLAAEPGVKIFIIGTGLQQQTLATYYKGDHKNVMVDMGKSVRQQMIIANRYNMVIAPDSFMIQVAGALKRNLVGLYGPFPSDLRMRYFSHARGLDAQTVCSPCFYHHPSVCIKGMPSPCWSQISAEDVLREVNNLYTATFEKTFTYVAKFNEGACHVYY